MGKRLSSSLKDPDCLWSPPIHHLDPMHPPPIQWIPGVLSLGIKQLVYKAEHSSPSGVEVMND